MKTKDPVKMGILDRIIAALIQRKTERVLKIMNASPALKRATSDVDRAMRKLEHTIENLKPPVHIE